jgi:formylglycine-generating enzyme required for sulfatase activity
VEQKKPNIWGLFDMHGNVWECVVDWYDPTTRPTFPQKDPAGPPAGDRRVLRGGGHCNGPLRCRAAYRRHAAPSSGSAQWGFRVAVSAER